MRPPFETFKGPTCKGCYALGTACGTCEKCKWELGQLSRGKSVLDMQKRVGNWVRTVLGENSMNKRARGMRFLEEAIELAQCCDVDAVTAIKILMNVYEKPVGNAAQEVGGAGTTLLALSESLALDALQTINKELVRIENLPPEKFRSRERENHAKGIGVLPDIK